MFNLNNSGPLQFVEKTFSQCSSEITAEFVLPCLIRPNNWEKHAQHTHKPRIGQSISIDAPNLSLCFSLQSQPIPHKHTLQLHWPLHTQSPKRSTTKSSCSVPTLQNPLQETFVPPPWQPPTVIDHFKTTHDQVFWRLHLSFNFLLSKDNSVHFFFCSVYQKITTNYFVIFLIDLHGLSGIYLKITTNIYVVFKGYIEGPLVRFFGFCSNPLSRLGLHFCNVFFLACARKM